MEDKRIVELFEARDSRAVEAVQRQYGEKLRRLAENLLDNWSDAAECVNDAYLAAWNAIPPAKPEPLLPWLYKVTRNLALKRCHRNAAKKRGGGSFTAAYEELENTVASKGTPAEELELKELGQLLNDFVRGLSPTDRKLFLGRYWFGEAYDTMALRLGLSENNCMVRVSRIRKKLRHYLQRKGAL